MRLPTLFHKVSVCSDFLVNVFSHWPQRAILLVCFLVSSSAQTVHSQINSPYLFFPFLSFVFFLCLSQTISYFCGLHVISILCLSWGVKVCFENSCKLLCSTWHYHWCTVLIKFRTAKVVPAHLHQKSNKHSLWPLAVVVVVVPNLLSHNLPSLSDMSSMCLISRPVYLSPPKLLLWSLLSEYHLYLHFIC